MFPTCLVMFGCCYDVVDVDYWDHDPQIVQLSLITIARFACSLSQLFADKHTRVSIA